jgi:hypothetical protein
MIDYMLVGLVSGLMVFFTLFCVSFITLGVITGLMRLLFIGYHGLQVGKSSAYREQTA